MKHFRIYYERIRQYSNGIYATKADNVRATQGYAFKA